MLARILLPAFAALALSFAPAAFAQTPAAFEPVTCATPADSVAEADAERALSEAIADFSARGYAGLTQHLPRMREIMRRAPDCYPLVERRGGEILVRATDQQSYLAIAQTLDSSSASIGIAPNIYPQVALLLGSYAVEMHSYEEALRWLDRGLVWQPRFEQLNIERASALLQLHRPAEALAQLQSLLDDPAVAPLIQRARVVRNAGVALIELNRLDEAEAALNESIRLQPENPIAQSELQYIAQLRRGAPTREVELSSPGAQGDSPPPQQSGKN